MIDEGRAHVAEIVQKFDQCWSFDGRDFERPNAEETLRHLIAQKPERYRDRLSQEFFGEGPVTALLGLEDLQEILINGPEDIWFENGGTFRRHSDRFLSDLTFKNFVDRLCAEAGIKVDLAQPFTDGRWRGFRVHVGCGPLTHCSFHLSLRRLSASSWSLNRLREKDWAPTAQIELLRRLVREKRNMLFIGPTGSGKTTVLGAVMGEFAESERAVIIEDTDELPRPNSASSKLLTRPVSGSLPAVDLADLVRQSLRMRPQRLVMGEVRGAEAKDLLLALATGHAGSLGTLHASDPRQALLRLEMLVQLGAPQWNVQAIRQLIQLSVEYLVVCGNGKGGRRLEGIYKVAALESFGFLLEPMAD